MGKKCCVRECTSLARVQISGLPKGDELRKTWLQVIGRNDLLDKQHGELNKYGVCRNHFSENDYKVTGKHKVLKQGTVPTLFLPGETVCETPEAEPSSVSDVLDHGSQNVDKALDSASDTGTTTHSEKDRPQDVDMPLDDTADDTRKMTHAVPQLSKKIWQVRGSGGKRKALTILRDAKRAKNLTPREQLMYKDIYRLKKLKLNSNRKPVSRKRRRAEEQAPKNKLESHLTGLTMVQREFVMMMIKNMSKKGQGRRYSTDMKLLALSLYKTMGGTAYSFLRQIFPLPNVNVLTGLLQNVPIQSGPSPFILKHLSDMRDLLEEADKICVLQFDEAKNQTRVEYKAVTDQVYGLEDWGGTRTNICADHALVFILRGLRTGWILPISYSFSKDQTKSAQMKVCIVQHIKAIREAGFRIVATVCDQGSWNIAAINSLIKDSAQTRRRQNKPERDTFDIDDLEVIPLYDPPHLLKGIRNNLITKFLEINVSSKKVKEEREFAKWSVIHRAYLFDKHTHNVRRMLPKLTDDHISPEGPKKMKVKMAAQILSGSMAGYLDLMSNMPGAIASKLGDYDIDQNSGDDAATTSQVCNFFNDLFDSVNAKEEDPDNPLRSPVTAESGHTAFWTSAKEKLMRMQFVNPKTLLQVKRVESLKNWKVTVEGFERLWKLLQAEGIQTFYTRFANQDPSENFFSCIRSHSPTNSHPTAYQFEQSFKTLLINNLSSAKTTGGNCEFDLGSPLFVTLKKFVANEFVTEDPQLQVEQVMRPSTMDINPDIIKDAIKAPEIASKILKNINCEDCHENTLSPHFLDSAIRASTAYSKFVGQVIHFKNVKSFVAARLEKSIDMSWHFCNQHHDTFQTQLSTVLSEILIQTWCHEKKPIFA